MQRSVFLIFVIVLSFTGCGKESSLPNSGGNLAINSIDSTPYRSTISAPVILSNFDLSDGDAIHIRLRPRMGRPPISLVSSANNFVITFQGDGQSAEEIQHYFEGSLQAREGRSLIITLGDRDISCIRRHRDGRSDGVQGVCLTDLRVGIPSNARFTVDIAKYDFMSGILLASQPLREGQKFSWQGPELPTDFETHALNQLGSDPMNFTGWYAHGDRDCNAAVYAQTVESRLNAPRASCLGTAIANIAFYFNCIDMSDEFIRRISAMLQQIIDLGVRVNPQACRPDGTHAQ